MDKCKICTAKWTNVKFEQQNGQMYNLNSKMDECKRLKKDKG